MLLAIPDVLSAEHIRTVSELLKDANFVDGRLSAGTTARKVKKNHELAPDSQLQSKLNNIVMNALFNHPMYQAAVLPHRIATPFYARYQPGEQYGFHVDDPVMGPLQGRYRTDVSTTVFLNNPEDYEGGEIVIQTQSGEQKLKLPAGSAITYPSGSLHRVAEVTKGERLVAVTWAQSMIRDADKRELLYNLHKTREALQNKYPGDEEVVKVDHTYINLMRMWSEI